MIRQVNCKILKYVRVCGLHFTSTTGVCNGLQGTWSYINCYSVIV